MIISGAIEEIEYFATPEKAIVTIKPDQYQTVYVEFKGSRILPVTEFNKGDMAEINIVFKGSKSRTVKKHYNNLIGRNIKRISSQQAS